jgi:hypothetical protein
MILCWRQHPSDPPREVWQGNARPHVNAYAYANERVSGGARTLTRLQDVDLYVTVWDFHPELVSFVTGLLLVPAPVSVEGSRGRTRK